MDEAKIKEAADKIRTLINDIEVMKTTETEAAEGQKIEDDAAETLKGRLQEIAQMLGSE